MGELGDADRHRQTAVLEQRDAVIDECRQGVAQRLGHQDVAHGADVAVPEGARCLPLARRRPKARSEILAEIGGLAESEPDDRKDGLAAVVRQKALHARSGKRLEIPKYHSISCTSVGTLR